MPKYQKPEVTSRGSTPEPIESGCCLRSCGGSPSSMQASRGRTTEAQETRELLGTNDANTRHPKQQ